MKDFSQIAGKLFLQIFKFTENSVLKQSLRSAKHGTGKNIVSKKNKDKKILDMLQKYDQEEHPVGEKISDEVRESTTGQD